MDLGLPDSQGLDTLRGIRSVAPSVPIVIITGLEDEVVGLASLEVGAEDYIRKSELSAGLLGHALTYSLQRRVLTDAIKLRTVEAEEQKMRAMTYFDLLAHDVANLIAPTILICDMIRLDKNVSAETRAKLKMVSTQATRAASMITNLRLLEALERTNPDDVEPINLIETISDVERGILTEDPYSGVEFCVHGPEIDRVIVKGGRWTRHVVSHLLRDLAIQLKAADKARLQVTISPVKDPSGKSFWRIEMAGDGLAITGEVEPFPFYSTNQQMRFKRGVAVSPSFFATFMHYFGGELTVRHEAKGGLDKRSVVILKLPWGE